MGGFGYGIDGDRDRHGPLRQLTAGYGVESIGGGVMHLAVLVHVIP